MHLCSCLIICFPKQIGIYFLDFSWNFAIFHHVNMKETISLMSWKCLFVHRDILYDIIHPSYPSRFTSFSSIGDKSSSHSWTSSLSRSLTLKHRTFGKTHIKIRRTITLIIGLDYIYTKGFHFCYSPKFLSWFTLQERLREPYVHADMWVRSALLGLFINLLSFYWNPCFNEGF